MAVNKCIKYSLFFFNLLFWISGCIILGVSVYLKVSKDGNKITNMAVPSIDLLIAIGVIITILGFLGCCGAIRENRCMLLLFFLGLLLIFTLLLAAGILGTMGEDKAEQWIKDRLKQLLPLANQTEEVKNDLQRLEEAWKCCGLIHGPDDWGSSIPPSCDCKEPSICKEGANVYKTPCVEFVVSFIKSHLSMVLGIAFAIAFLMLFGMSFAMTLYCQIGKMETSTA